MKKLCILICAALCTVVTAHAADEISVYVDRQKLEFEVQPQIINDYTMVPMRTIFERLGYTVNWDQETRMIEAVNYQINKGILLIVDVPQMILYNCDELNSATDMNVFISNHTYNLDIAPTIVDDNTLVPLRAVSEASGAGVIWNGSDRAVYITMPRLNIEEYTPEPTEPIAEPEPIQPAKPAQNVSNANTEKFINEAFSKIMNDENDNGNTGAVIGLLLTSIDGARRDLELYANSNTSFKTFLNSLTSNEFNMIYQEAESQAYETYIYYLRYYLNNYNSSSSSAAHSYAMDEAYNAYLYVFTSVYGAVQ